MKKCAIELSVQFYQEGNKVVAYSRALDLSTCGKDFEQARKRFDEASSIFIEEIIRMGTFEEVLLSCGWRKSNHPVKHWEQPREIAEIKESLKIPCPI